MSRLNDLISSLDLSKKIFIQTHNYPDPDAIASAFGLKYLLSKHNIDTHICYHGTIEKFSTKKLVTRLNIPMQTLNDVEDELFESSIILLDAQKNNSNTTLMGCNIVACIDHHCDNGLPYNFKDVRPYIGSCSTIITEYFVEQNENIPEEISTALMFGIKVDTLDFTRRVDLLDINMYAALYGRENAKILDELQKDKLVLSDLKVFSNALRSVNLIDDIGFVNVGNNCSDALLASVSDFILSIEEINFAISYSCRENGIKLSVRSQIDSLDSGKIICQALEGIGGGGGHKEMAGGIIPKASLSLIDDYIGEFIKNRFLTAIYSYEYIV